MTPEYYKVNVPGEHLYDLEDGIQVRKITPIEQKRLVSILIRDEKDHTIEIIRFINTLIKGIDPNELYWPDYYYLLYQMRLVTYKMFPIEFVCECPDCGEKQKVQLDVPQLEIDEVPDTYKKNTKLYLENFGEVPFRYKKVKDDIMIAEFMKAHNIAEDDIAMIQLLYDLCLLSDWKPLEELWALAETGEITMQDIVVLEDFMTKCMWGVKEELKYTCRKCGKEVASSYEMQLADFFPSNFN